MPSARAAIAMAVNPGLVRITRKAKRTSAAKVPMKLKTSARRAKLQKMYPEQYRVAVRTLKLMKTTIAIVGALWCAAALAQPAPTVAGHWQGKIQLPNHDLEITVDLDRNPKGAWI